MYPPPVSDATDLVIIGTDGSIRIKGRGAERRLRDRAGRYQLIIDAPGLVILREEHVEGIDEKRTTRVGMAGELLTRTTTLEIINIVANARWRGELHIMDGVHHRVLAVAQGALKWARSNSPDDRLGQILYQNGTITRAQLDSILREVSPERRIGQLLLDRELITQEGLFVQLQKQVEHIFFSALLIRGGGHYVFSVTDEDDEHVPHHTVHLPIQALLMEGVQRIDEMALFRNLIPRDDLCPVVQSSITTLTLDEKMQLVVTYADGDRSIEDIARETGLGLFMTMKSLYAMMQQGGVILRPQKVIDTAEIKHLVGQFNEVLLDIFMAVATYGGVAQTRSTLEAWIDGSGYGPIFGDRVDEDGCISPDTVVDAMLSVEADNPLESLHQALHELAAFALFAATTTLPRDQELALSRDVNTRLKRIRI